MWKHDIHTHPQEGVGQEHLLMMDQTEECKSIPSKKNMMDNKKKRSEFDEGREPLILMSATNIHHRGLSYPPGCPITKRPPLKGPVQHEHQRGVQGPQECESLAQQREIGADGRQGRAQTINRNSCQEP